MKQNKYQINIPLFDISFVAQHTFIYFCLGVYICARVCDMDEVHFIPLGFFHRKQHVFLKLYRNFRWNVY